jgi:hypothetical protein
LEKLLGPVALYPDPLIATVLPAAAYPLEIVEAARFVKDTNNIPNLDSQPWDANVKAVARLPAVINKMNDDLTWTSDLGQAFIDQPKDVMDTIQELRAKAQGAGTLKTTPQQVVVVTNTVVEKTVEQQVVMVTNTVVQIQPAQPEVIYVPQYNPAVVYAPPPPGYTAAASIVSFGVGMAVGAAIANNCDWHGGGVYVGGYHGDVNVNVNRNVNVNNNFTRNNVNVQNRQINNQQKWQPDQSRLRNSGSPGASQSLQSAQARGWGGGANQTQLASANAARSTTPGGPGAQQSRPAQPQVNRPASSPAANRATAPSSSPAPNRAGGPGQGGFAGSQSGHSGAFGGLNSGSQARGFGNRGAASRGGTAGGGRFHR